MAETEPGAYTVRETVFAHPKYAPPGVHVSGRCAGCLEQVNEGDAFVIRHHPNQRGGIFHQRCEPKGDGWYGVTGEAADA